MSKSSGILSFFKDKKWLSITGIVLSFIVIIIAIGVLFNQFSDNIGRAAGETVQFAQSTSFVKENAKITGISVVLNQTATNDVSFEYTISGGTAKVGQDFLVDNKTITIPTGSNRATIPLRVLDNTSPENNKTIQVTLSNPVGGVLGATTSTTLTILEDDYKYDPLGSNTETLANLDYNNPNTTLTVTSGLRLKLDAETISGSNGSAVSNWSDGSSFNTPATQSVPSEMPTLLTNAINGKKMVRFDGTQSLQVPHNANLNSNAQTIITVANFGSSYDTWEPILGKTTSTSWNDGFALANNSNTPSMWVNDYTTNPAINPTSLLTSKNYLFTGSFGDGSVNLSINGNKVATNSYSNTLTTNTAPFEIGAAGGYKLTGDIAEVLVYNRVLTAAETEAVEGYLNNKYALRDGQLQLHLDASNISGANDSEVTTWSDISGKNNNATQSTTADKPKLKTGTNGINGKNTVRFDGTDDFLNLPSGFADFDEGITSFVITRPDVIKSNSRLFDLGNGEANDNLLFYRYGPYNEAAFNFANGNTLTGETVTTGESFKTGQVSLLTGSAGDGTTKIYKNGSLQATTTTPGINNITRTSNFIAKSDWSADEFYSGDLAEVLIYNKVLNAGERQQVECYLAGKYDLAASGCSKYANKLWLDAGTIGQANASAVTSWNDISGNGNNATQATTANAPSYRTGVINSRNVVRFDGVDDKLETNLYSRTSPQSIVSVFKQNAWTDYGGIFDSVSATQAFALEQNPTTNFARMWSGGSTTSLESNLGTTNFRVVSNIFDQSRSRLGVNGVTGALGDAGGSVGNGLTIGSLGANNPYFANVDVAEVMTFNSALTLSQRAVLEAYLSGKYNIALTGGKYNLNTTAPNNIVGIGADTDGVLDISGSSNGLLIKEVGDSLRSGEYVLAGSDSGTKNTVTTLVPAGVTSRWNRIWGLRKTSVDGINAKINFDFSDYAGGVPGASTNYRLLYRASTTGNFSVVTTASTTIEQDQVSFSVINANLLDGYYTLGTTSDTNSPIGIPANITNLTSTNSGQNVNLAWTAPSGSPTDYQIQYSTDNFVNDINIFNDGISSTASSTVTGLKPSTKYAFKVIAINSSGVSSTSNTPSATTNGASPTISSLSPASGHTAGGYEVSVNGTNFVSPNYKRQIEITNTGTTLSDFQTSFNIDTKALVDAGKLMADCKNIKILDSDEFTGLNFYIQSGCNTTSTKIWVKIPNIPNGTKNIFLKYGFAEVLDYSNSDLVFDFYDDFNGTSLDTNKWNLVNNTGISVANGYLFGTNTSNRLLTNRKFGAGVVQEVSVKTTAQAANGNTVAGFFKSYTDNLGLLDHPGSYYVSTDGAYYIAGGTPTTNNVLVTTTVKDGSTAVVDLYNQDTNTLIWNSGDITNSVSDESISLGGRYDSNTYDNQTYSSQWDFVSVRKYSAIEPSLSIQSEQTENASTLSLASVNLTNVTYVSSTLIKYTAPAKSVGTYSLVYTNPSSQTATSSFTYNAPTIGSLSPNTGPATGGTQVTINGNNFSNLGYYQKLTVNNSVSSITNYQLSFNIDTASLISAGKMRSDCGDLRVKDTDNSTLLSYFVESGCNTSSTKIWTKIPSLNNGNNDIYIHYGKPSLATISDPSAVFDFYDGFDGSSVDSTKWTGTGTVSQSGGNLNLGVSSGLFANNYLIPADSILETYASLLSTGSRAMPVRAAVNSGGAFANFTSSNQISIWVETNNFVYASSAGSSTSMVDINGTGFRNYAITYRPGGVDQAIYNYNNGENIQTRTGIQATGTLKPAIYFGSFGTGGNWDYYRVRKNISTLPTVTFNSEVTPVTVTFDGLSAKVLSVSPTQIIVQTPAHTNGVVNVIATNTGGITTGATGNSAFTYAPPVVTSVSPNSGPTVGGNQIIVTGNNFDDKGYERIITITSAVAETDFVFSFALDSASLIGAGKMRSDCGDIRVKDSTGATNLPYFLVSGCNTANTTIRTKVPTIPIGNSTIKVQYGNLALTSQSNEAAVGANAGNISYNFESGDLSDFTMSGDAGWEINTQEFYAGTQSAANMDIDDSQVANMELEVNITADTTVQYYDKVSSESGFDYLRFYINNVLQREISGEEDWSAQSFPLTAGTQVLRWEYIKDGSVTTGNDTGYIDDLLIGGIGNAGFSVNVGQESSLTQVYFGSNAASFVKVDSSTQLTVTVPSGSGSVGVKVVNSDGSQSNTNINYNYVAPTVTQISPNSGPNSGGTYVTVTGSNFGNAGNKYTKIISVDNDTAGVISNYISAIKIDTKSLISSGKVRADCGDIRVKSPNNSDPLGNSDTTNVLSYWVDGCNSVNTLVWFKVPSLALDTNTFYLTYGDQSLTTTQNINDFPFGSVLSQNSNRLWIAANNVSVDNESLVTSIPNRADPANNLSLQPNYNRALLNSTGINTQPSFSFNPTSSYPFNRISDIRSVFWVLQENDTTVHGNLLGDTNSNDFSRNGEYLWYFENASSNVTDGDTYLNSSPITPSISAKLEPNTPTLVSLITAGTVEANTLSESSNLNSKSFDGEISELIIFNTALNTTDRQAVEDYLKLKYQLSGSSNPTAKISAEQSFVLKVGSKPLFDTAYVNSQTATGFVAHGTGQSNVTFINSDNSSGTGTNLYTYGTNNVPNPILDLTKASEEGQKVKLSWTSPMDNGANITDYVVKYSQNNFVTETVYNDGVNTNNYVEISGLNIGQSYQFKVLAVNSVGTSASSNIISITSLDCDTNLSGADLIPANNAVLSGSYCNVNNFNVGSGITVTLNNQVTSGGKAVKIYAQNSSILGTINGDDRGFVGGQIGQNGTGPGKANYYSNLSVGPGHGGWGSASNGIDGGKSYGSITEPIDLGSGGAGTNGAIGGNGGGAIKITTTNNLIVNGNISVRGGVNTNALSGSGGSIWLQTNNLSGTGTLNARSFGTGAGGRIAVYYSTSTFNNNNITAFGGGGGAQAAGAGTIYVKPASQSFGDLIIKHNAGGNTAKTDINDENYKTISTVNNLSFSNGSNVVIDKDLTILNSNLTISNNDNITNNGVLTANNLSSLTLNGGFVQNGILNSTALTSYTQGSGSQFVSNNLWNAPVLNTMSISGTTSLSTYIFPTINALTVNSGGNLTHKQNSTTSATPIYKLNLTTENLNIATGGKISADQVGYTGGNIGQNGNGPGASEHYVYDPGGAGYGGNGGENGSLGGVSYGSLSEPVDLGSGAASSGDSEGGNGGGAIKLVVNNTLTLNGLISANGGSDQGVVQNYYPGAGSGGSIWIQTNTLSGNGSIEAKGGNNGFNSSGGGSGGRVALYYQNRNNAQTVNVDGGGGNGDCVEGSEAAYPATTSGCTGTFYDPNTPESNITTATLDTNPNPVSQNSGFSVTINNIKNIFGGLLYSGVCELTLSGPGNYTTPVVVTGTINQGVCPITTPYTAPNTTGTMNAVISVTNNVTETQSTSFTIYAPASNKAKAQLSPNQTKPVYTALVPNPLLNIIGTPSSPTLTATGFVDSGNSQALNGIPCSFNVTGPNSYSESFASSNVVGGSCSYTFSTFELPTLTRANAGDYNFSVTIAGKDITNQDVNLTTDTASFSRYYDIYLENPNTSGVFDYTGNIPGALSSSPSTVVYQGGNVILTSPIIKKYDNITNLSTGLSCTITLEINNNSNITTQNFNSTINSQGQCQTTITTNNFSTGIARIKATVYLNVNSQSIGFETNWTTVTTSGFPSNLAKYNPTPIIPTAELQPIYLDVTASPSSSIVQTNVTLYVDGLRDSVTDGLLNGPTCSFTVTRPNSTTINKVSVATSNGYCYSEFSDADLSGLSGIFSFRVEVAGQNASNANATLTTPSVNFSRIYDINLTGADGLTGTIPGVLTSDPAELQVNAPATIYSPTLYRYNSPSVLPTNIACQNVTRFVNNLNQQSIITKDSFVDTNGLCVTTLANTDLPLSGEAYIKTRVSLLGSSFATTNGDIFETAETQIPVRSPAQSKICLPTFRDDNSNRVFDSQATNNQTNQFGQDEPYLTGVTTTLLDNNLAPISGQSFTTALPTVGNPDINCFKDLYDGDYYVQQDLLAGTNLTLPDPNNAPVGTTILRDTNNQIIGIRYAVALAINETETFTTGYNAGSQICVNYSYADLNGNAVFDGDDYKFVRSVRLYASNNLTTALATINTSLTDPVCFTNLPPSNYDNSTLEYVVEQTIPNAELGFIAGSELTTTSQTLTGSVVVTLTQEESNTKARTNALTLSNSQNLSELVFGYKPLPSQKAKAQANPNQTLPIFTTIDHAAQINTNEVPNKIYKGYKFNTRVNGLVDSATDTSLDIPNNSQGCSITYSGPSFNTNQQAYGTVSNGTCLVDPIPDNEGTGNTATMTIPGDSGNLAASGNFDVLSGALNVCSYTFADYNADGLFQSETYLGGRTIKLYNNATNVEIQSSITSSVNGTDCFENVAPGIEYRLEQTPFANNITTTNSGNPFYIFTPDPEQNQNFAFGYRGNSTICSYSFRDDSGDGVKNTNAYGENEIYHNGVFSTTLLDELGNTVGSYLVDNTTCFTNLLPGNFTLSQSYGLGFSVSRTNFITGFTEITNLGAGTTVQREFGYKSIADICPYPTYKDYNKNGIYDSGEAFISGITVKLFRVSNNQQIGSDLLTDGTNCFEDVIPDDYRLEQTKVSGSTLTTITTSDITYSQNSTTSTAEFTLEIGIEKPVSFGYKGNSSVCPYPTFKDYNKNGQKDGADSDIDGVLTTLKDINDITIDTLLTNAGSALCFTEIMPGDYRIIQESPVNTTSTTGGLDKTVDDLLSGQTRNISFGYNGDPRICPAIYRDDNSNTIFDTEEVRLGGVLVTLKDSSGTTTLSTLTSSTINTNCFNDLTSGTYRVEVSNLNNYTLTTVSSRQVTVDFGDSASPEFGFNGSGSICVDPTYRDSNGNGTFDLGESKFANVNTYLRYPNNDLVLPLQQTDVDGITCFTGIAPGQYTVSQDAPIGSTSTTGGTQSILLTPAENKTLAFGYNGSGNICPNPTFDDPNFNGIKNTTENLISGVTTRLYLKPDTTNPIAAFVTDNTGTQCFVGLFPGDYRLTQDIPSGYGVGSSTTGGNSQDFSLTAGEYKSVAFGYTTNPDFALAAISGFLYIDRNENGAYNPYGSDAAQITVYDNDIPVTLADVQLYKRNTTTSIYELQTTQQSLRDPQNPESDGTFAFTGLLPGDYKVVILAPLGTQSVIPNPSERLVTITGSEKISDFLYGFQYTARICPALFVDKNNNGIIDGTDLDLKTSNGGYYQLSYESFNGTQIASNGNSYGFLINASNPCIEKVPPRDYTVVLRSDLAGILNYSSSFDTNLYNLVTPDQTATIFLGNQVDITNRYYTDFVPDFTNSIIRGKIWNNRFNYSGYDTDGYDNQTGIDSGFNRDYDNDFDYSGVSLSLKKCAPGFGELQVDVDNWNANQPTATTNSTGEYTFPTVSPGRYAVIRNTTLPFQIALNGLPTNDCDVYTNDIFINNLLNASGGYAPGSTIDYNIIANYKASVTNTIYVDQNHNGIYDSWETNGQFGNYLIGDLTLKESNGNTDSIQNSAAFPLLPPYSNEFPAVPPDNYTVQLNPDSNNIYPLNLADQSAKSVSVSTASNSQNLTFGFNPTDNSSISGKVFIDRNSDNTYQAGGADNTNTTVFDNDIIQSGSTIELYYGSNLNPVPGQLVATTVTDVNGDYSFTNIPEGYYSARIITPPPAGTACIRCDWGINTVVRYDVVYVQKDSNSIQNLRYNYNSSLNIRAFHDTIANSVRDTNEVDAENMLYTVSSADGYSLGTISANQFNSGSAQFVNLPAGVYTVNISNIPSSISVTGAITNPGTVEILASENYIIDYPFTPFTNNTLQGYVFVDRNRDNILQLDGADNNPTNSFDNERIFAGSTVRVNGPLGTYTATTDANGFYQINSLPSGNYKLHKPDLDADVDLNDPASTQLVFSCYTAITCKTYGLGGDGKNQWSLNTAQRQAISEGINLTNDATSNSYYTYSYTGTLNAQCIDDLNGDGTITYYPDTNYTETTITGCSFRITTPTGEFLTFDPETNISSTSLPPGTYTITKLTNAPNRINTNTTRRDSTPFLNLGSQDQVSATFTTGGGTEQKAYYNFMQFTQPTTNNAAITGKVYVDRAQDSIYQVTGLDNNALSLEDNDVLLPNIPISLSGTTLSGNVTRNTSTNNIGKYQFTDLPGGTYDVTADLGQ